MKAEESSLKDILEREPHRLEVPFFQRKYVWNEENWSELLESVDNFQKEKEFWGSIIIKMAKERGPRGCSKGYIIDGQQRLTTLAILTKAIYDTLDDVNKRRMERYIQGDVFFAPQASCLFEEDEYELIIEHSRADKKDFEEIVKAGIYNDEIVDIECEEDQDTSKIKSCYAYFRKNLRDRTIEELTGMIDVLYGDDKIFVLIMLGENDVNEQTLFDSINRAGQKLYTSDIIKNNLFKELVNKSGDRERISSLCDVLWDSIFWAENGVSIWDEKRNFGNIGKSHLDFLLYCVACIEWPCTSVKRLNENLEQVYLENTEIMDETALNKLVEKIATIALIYKKYIIDFGENLNEIVFTKHDTINRLLLIMEKLRIQMFYPYILKVLYKNIDDCNIKKQIINCNLMNIQLNSDVKSLEKYIMRRRLCSASTSKYADKCLEILREDISALFSNYNEDNIKMENKDIIESINNLKNSDVAKLTLFCLELERWDEADDLGSMSYTYQLEHVMPLKWEKYWVLPNQTEEKVNERNHCITKLGNMVLLSQKLNDKISNREYVVKMKGELANGRKSAKEGYRDKSQLKLTKELIDAFIQGDVIWDEEHINKRTEKLGKEILEHWNIGTLKNNC